MKEKFFKGVMKVVVLSVVVLASATAFASTMPFPQQQAQINLDGTWSAMVNGQQWVMQYQGNQYQGYVNGAPAEAGWIQIHGNVMSGQTTQGGTFSNHFQWSADGMSYTVTASNGFSIVYRRMQQQQPTQLPQERQPSQQETLPQQQPQANPSVTTATNSGGLLIRTEHILDPQMGNAVAATVAVPSGWQITQGRVNWNFDLFENPAELFIVVTNPADNAEVALLSSQEFYYSQLGLPGLGGSLKKQPVTAEDFLKEYINAFFSDVKVINVTKPQAFSEFMAKKANELQQSLLSIGVQVKVTSDCACVEYTYMGSSGRCEGEIMVGTTYSESSTELLGARGVDVGWSTTPIIGVSAHVGKLAAHKKDFAVILDNSYINPAWQEVILRVVRNSISKKLDIQIAQSEAFRNEMQRTHENITNTRRDLFTNRQDSLSNVSRGWGNVFADTDTWRGGGTSYSAPTGYNYGWSDGSGNTYYTNDSTFNPNHSSDFRGDWSQMEKTPW